jgi:hypothetical protein
MRGFLASLLQSDISQQEMYELADELSSGSFGRDLGDYLRNWIHIGEVGRDKEFDRYDEKLRGRDSMLAVAVETISRRRMSKKMVTQIMALASNWVKPSQLQASGTTKEMVEKYLLTAPLAEANKFLSILEGEPADAYMKGIARRDRAK